MLIIKIGFQAIEFDGNAIKLFMMTFCLQKKEYNAPFVLAGVSTWTYYGLAIGDSLVECDGGRRG